MKAAVRVGISVLALTIASQSAAQDKTDAASGTPQIDTSPPTSDQSGDIVVSGIRGSLEKAATIKKNSVQIVDSIVATDIGKFPDPTTAAALQRVPGVQVQYDRGNELGGVRVRGLPDTLTTVNGREVFTSTGRNFNLTDLPAEALARVDVVKSQTADLIEGGLAGNIDLQLNKPFNFKKTTVVLNARGNYGVRTNEVNPQFGALATTRFNTGIGEMGLLINGTWSKTYSFQPESTMADPRATATAPLNTGANNYIFPSIWQNIAQFGQIWHTQVNASYQWQIAPKLQFYADGFYTSTKNMISYTAGGNLQPYTTNTSISDIVADPDACYTARFNASTGQNANIVIDKRTGTPYIVAVPAVAGGPQDTSLYKVQNLCFVKSATVRNAVINQTTHADNFLTHNKSIAGGLNYDADRLKAVVDVSYQTSRNYDESVTADVGQRLPLVMLETEVNGEPRLTVPGDNLLRRDTLSLRNSISQNYQLSNGKLFQVSLKGTYEVGGFLKKIEVGARYANRSATYQQYRAVTPLPAGFGTIGVGANGDATARLISSLPLSYDFLEFGPPAPAINGGAIFYVPSVDYLRSQRGRNELRALFGLPQGQPPYDPSKQFDATEKTIAGYGQASYDLPLWGNAKLDGVVGVRVTRVERDLTTFAIPTGGTAFAAVNSTRTYTDALPNASARLSFGNGIQLRGTYAKTIRRPDFTLLNPTLSLTLSPNPFLVNNGSAGNPDLRAQKADTFDASLEYYFKSGYIAVTGYYLKLKDRVITSPATENYGGVDYSVSRPRNVGQATLKGVEVSGQLFFDFLPGAFSGFGVFGSFTFADSKIGGNDQLAGNPLQGVSKYNYTAGLLYDKFGISGRLVYTYRSEAWQDDSTGGLGLRPVDPARANQAYVPVLFRWLRPNGRLDFSLGYDLSDAVRLDIGGTNITRQKNQTYWGVPFINSQTFAIETTYTVGARVKF